MAGAHAAGLHAQVQWCQQVDLPAVQGAAPCQALARQLQLYVHWGTGQQQGRGPGHCQVLKGLLVCSRYRHADDVMKEVRCLTGDQRVDAVASGCLEAWVHDASYCHHQ